MPFAPRRRLLPWKALIPVVLSISMTGVSVEAAAEAISAGDCGTVRSKNIGWLGAPKNSAKVFVRSYDSCSNAKRVMRRYLRRVDLTECEKTQATCARRIDRWRCTRAYEHGTLVRCLSGSGKGRLIGLTR